jgi:hypothetical protein
LLFELLDQTVMGCLTPDAVDIHTGDTGFGENLFQVFLDTFRPEIALDKPMVAAGGTGGQRGIYGTAIMTVQFIGQLMKVERHVAVTALGIQPQTSQTW